MEMRDRLIELIRQSCCVDVWNYHTDDFKEPNPIETLADHLLANGVIVPPCKVGDIEKIVLPDTIKSIDASAFEGCFKEEATCKDCFHYCVCKDTVADENWVEAFFPEEVREMFSPRGCEDYVPAADMIEREIVEKAKLDILNRMEELKNEWKSISESAMDTKYTQFYSGRADGIETGQRIVKIVLEDVLDGHNGGRSR